MSAIRPQVLTKPVIGGTAQGVNPSGSIIIPAYENHADRIFSGTPSALDDHFDGGTLNAKWSTVSSAGLIYNQIAVAGSKLSIGGMSPSAVDNVIYSNGVYASLPNANNFILTIRVDLLAACEYRTSSWMYFDFEVYSDPNAVGAGYRMDAVYAGANSIYYGLGIYGGTSAVNLIAYFDPMPYPKYLRYQWTLSTRELYWSYSLDGITFQHLWNATVAHGMTAGKDPTHVYLLNNYRNSASALTQIDWIKFVNF